VAYASCSRFILGPFDPFGSFSSSVSTASSDEQTQSFRSFIDRLDQGSGIFGEKGVSHLQVSGDLKVIPALADTIPLFDDYNTSKVRWNCRYYSNGSIAPVVDSKLGLPISGKVYDFPEVGRRYIVHMDAVSSFRILYYQLIMPTWLQPSSDSYIDVEQHEIRLVQKVDNSIQWTDTMITVRDRKISTKIKHRDELLIASIVSEIFASNVQTVSAPNYGLSGLRKTFSVVEILPEEIRKAINASVFTQDLVSSPIVPKPFGDLAMEASQKTLRNDVNMIAFIRDLKNPKALIPKLKNLRSVKTHAGNYLGVKYGVLPTADDLTNIVESLKKVSPFLDKNGFTIQTAVAVSRSTIQVAGKPTDFELEQRIKIAIDNEDVDFSDLIQRIESAGFLPTFENIWDLVPYSFVLDWFINVGDFLERVDTRLRLLRLNIRYATMSSKSSKSFSLNIPLKYATAGKLTIQRYDRWTQDHSPVPPLLSESTITAQNHWLEGSALIITRRKN